MDVWELLLESSHHLLNLFSAPLHFALQNNGHLIQKVSNFSKHVDILIQKCNAFTWKQIFALFFFFWINEIIIAELWENVFLGEKKICAVFLINEISEYFMEANMSCLFSLIQF